MKLYFAPMEGITGYLYRNAHHTFFNHIDKYFTPFIVPTQTRKFASKEFRDVLPEHNAGLYVVPQILTNDAQGFIWAARELKKAGYDEVNLNLGCPSKTVVSKSRGAGFLAKKAELDCFLGEIFGELDLKISVKTRIGKDSPEEFYELMQIFNQYQMEELIIHPRVQLDYYKNKPNLDIYKAAVSLSKNPLCYNGDIFSLTAYKDFTDQFPETEKVMVGRGLIANPGLSFEIKGGGAMDKARLRRFHDRIFSEYKNIMSGDRNVLFKMKEIWIYMGCMFEDSGKYIKRIKKAEKLAEYDYAVEDIFQNCELSKGGAFKCL